MSQYLIGVTHKEISSMNGYAWLSADVIDSAVKSWQKDKLDEKKLDKNKYDIFKWLENPSSDKWFDYMGLNKSFFKGRLEERQLEGSGIIRRDFG